MKLYIYDHCPYCVKARMIFGFKNVPVELLIFLNDDVDTPVRMIGKKMVPVLQKEDGSYMPESMDIVHYIDANYGKPVVHPVPKNDLYQESFLKFKSTISPLAMPRWVKAPLGEFKTPGAIHYFTEKKEAMIGSFAAHFANSAALITETEKNLQVMEHFIQSDSAVHGRLTEDDFHLFAALRSLSIVKGVRYPARVEAWRQTISRLSKVPLHDTIAI